MPPTVFKSDAQIREDTLDELERHWQFRPAEIGVEVDAGIVTLSGTVSSHAKLLAAADVAANIAGVRGVANELVVRTSGMDLPTDAEIATSVSNAFRVDPDINDEAIDIIVRDGIVTLKGTVRYWHQRRTALETVRRIRGVVALNDDIKVVPQTRSDAEMKDEIRKALQRRIPLASDHIRVDIASGVVTLRGNVQFYTDRVQAERSAWMTEGVRNVIDLLTTTW